MNEIIVPIDLTREEKEVLGMLSLRQFFYIFPTVLFAFVFALFIPLPFNLLTDIVIKVIVVILVLGAGAAMAFIRLPKYEVGLDTFIKNNVRYRKEQQEFF